MLGRRTSILHLIDQNKHNKTQVWADLKAAIDETDKRIADVRSALDSRTPNGSIGSKKRRRMLQDKVARVSFLQKQVKSGQRISTKLLGKTACLEEVCFRLDLEDKRLLDDLRCVDGKLLDAEERLRDLLRRATAERCDIRVFDSLRAELGQAPPRVNPLPISPSDDRFSLFGVKKPVAGLRNEVRGRDNQSGVTSTDIPTVQDTRPISQTIPLQEVTGAQMVPGGRLQRIDSVDEPKGKQISTPDVPPIKSGDHASSSRNSPRSNTRSPSSLPGPQKAPRNRLSGRNASIWGFGTFMVADSDALSNIRLRCRTSSCESVTPRPVLSI